MNVKAFGNHAAPNPTYIQEEYPFATAPPQVTSHPRQVSSQSACKRHRSDTRAKPFRYYDPAPYATYIQEDAPFASTPFVSTPSANTLFASALSQAVSEGYPIFNDHSCWCGTCAACIERVQQTRLRPNHEHRIARAEQERRANLETQRQTFVGYPEPRAPKRARFADAPVPQFEQRFVWQTPAEGYSTEEIRARA